jgi:8-oxo-dGTP pyrophosphatase MutT (NUDIX family)
MIGFPRFRQAAALPFDSSHPQGRFLLITSLGTRRWILPKGNIEPGLTARESAEFEAFEEAGVIGRVAGSSIGTFTYDKTDDGEPMTHHVKVFPLEVRQMLERYPDSDLRKRQWMTPSEAAAAVDEQALKDLLVRFSEEYAG